MGRCCRYRFDSLWSWPPTPDQYYSFLRPASLARVATTLATNSEILALGLQHACTVHPNEVEWEVTCHRANSEEFAIWLKLRTLVTLSSYSSLEPVSCRRFSSHHLCRVCFLISVLSTGAYKGQPWRTVSVRQISACCVKSDGEICNMTLTTSQGGAKVKWSEFHGDSIQIKEQDKLKEEDTYKFGFTAWSWFGRHSEWMEDCDWKLKHDLGLQSSYGSKKSIATTSNY